MTTATTVPQSPEELKEMLLDSKYRAQLMADPDQFQQWVNDYARTFADKDHGEVLRLAAEQSQQQLAELLRAAKEEGFGPEAKLGLGDNPSKAELSAFAVGARKGTAYNSAAPGARIDREAQLGVADYFRSVWWNYSSQPDSEKLVQNRALLQRIANEYSSDIPSEGGFLIPETMRSEVLRLSLEQAIVRPRATVIPMSSLRLPVPTIDETSHVASVRGGLVGYWTEEGAELVASAAKFGRVMLEAKKLTIYAEVPNELPADAMGFSALLGQILPEAVAWFEDDGFTNGNGSGEPEGWVESSGRVSFARQAAGKITWLDVVTAYSRMLPQSLSRAVWVASMDSLPTLATITTNPDGTGFPLLINVGGLPDAPRLTLLGRPLLLTEKVPALGSQGDLSFVDFGEYLIGDRQAMQAESSREYKFGSDKTAYRVIERVDGMPWIQTPLTPRNGGPTLSPIVQLDAG